MNKYDILLHEKAMKERSTHCSCMKRFRDSVSLDAADEEGVLEPSDD
ncbi:hypothetical protein M3N64_09635 [Sporolactobacillus sp. CPB3-1]|uniref:Uncharacterized protein n=1 Tax=Sporolactobacillus mangiferae TaxID=2940498 RepID=A0ABT0MD11_9BACL|nr:hypothetical protein [Sporolactobacillus mangiferae]MCL1632200.1 hypothetical protein [Sporolactobacillus mangiferae]